jgi:hypothetical protein
MKKFLTHYFEEEFDGEDVNEALTMQQRQKRKASFRKNKSKIKRGIEKAKKKIASPEKLKGKARKAAQKEVESKILGGKKKADLSFSARSALEKKVKGKKGLINTLAKKKLKDVKKADRARVKNARSGNSDKKDK